MVNIATNQINVQLMNGKVVSINDVFKQVSPQMYFLKINDSIVMGVDCAPGIGRLYFFVLDKQQNLFVPTFSARLVQHGQRVFSTLNLGVSRSAIEDNIKHLCDCIKRIIPSMHAHNQVQIELTLVSESYCLPKD